VDGQRNRHDVRRVGVGLTARSHELDERFPSLERRDDTREIGGNCRNSSARRVLPIRTQTTAGPSCRTLWTAKSRPS
jgi:hypothetical protein